MDLVVEGVQVLSERIAAIEIRVVVRPFCYGDRSGFCHVGGQDGGVESVELEALAATFLWR